MKTNLNLNLSTNELMKTPTKGLKENFDLTFFSQMEAPRKTYNKFMVPSMSLAEQMTYTHKNYFREEPAETD